MSDIRSVLSFLSCRTSSAWVECAVQQRDDLLLDHATLELKAAQQAQKMIRKYGASARSGRLSEAFRRQLMRKMSRLAREELRHFEQVLELLESRGITYYAVSPSRYASGLHEMSRTEEPGALVDELLIGAIIEARSCERFDSLVPQLAAVDQELAKFYRSLLKSESRHFEDYLELARAAATDDVDARVEQLLERDAELIQSPDTELRFHSGMPAAYSLGPSTTSSSMVKSSHSSGL